MLRPRRPLLLFLLLALLAVSPAWGRPSRRPATGASGASSQTRLLVLLSSWLGRALPQDWLKAGCMIDPNGRCLPAPTSEAGCMIDPDGSCAPNTFSEAGCMVDPNGQCAPGH